MARWLLKHPTEPLTQRELARATETDEGYASRVVRKLIDDRLIVRIDAGTVRPRDPDLLADLSFREDVRGANVWLVVPNDEGVFHGATTTPDGINCVHPIQVYLDLHAQPERARDIARELRSEYLHWRIDR